MKQFIGGQALIEGVMMKSKDKVAYAARKPNGDIVVKKVDCSSITEKNKLLRLPIIRGIIFLFEMMIIGTKGLVWSANEQEEKEEEQLSKKELFGTIVFSFLLTALMFVIIPFYLTKIFVSDVNLVFNLIDGIIRLATFVLYVWIIGMFSDVKRIFQYHGAEHKAVHCYESGRKLSTNNVQRFSTLHPRCGTSLIVFIIAISIILFSLIKTPTWYYNIALRIIIIPLLGGIGYEIAKLSAKHSNNKFLKYLVLPGLWVQKITTNEPDNQQVEVAIKALKEVL